MKIIDRKEKQFSNKYILIRVLIIFLFLVSILPLENQKVVAQQPNNQVYLPIVIKADPVICPDGPDQWLCLLNYYRSIAGVNPVTQNGIYNDHIGLHTNYMLLNPTQANVHTEYVGNPGYSEEGKTAAGQSNMISLIGGVYLTPKQSIELWLATPNHRYHMLHPDLDQSGFDLSCDSKNCFSGLNILASLPRSFEIQKFDLVYPADKQQGIPASEFPISWSFYLPWTSSTNDNDEVRFVSATIRDSSNKSVSFTKAEPNHSDGAYEYINQVVLTPSENLTPGKIYSVNMTVSIQGKTYTKSWSFTTAP